MLQEQARPTRLSLSQVLFMHMDPEGEEIVGQELDSVSSDLHEMDDMHNCSNLQS